jgi:hypothetical protein
MLGLWGFVESPKEHKASLGEQDTLTVKSYCCADWCQQACDAAAAAAAETKVDE